MLQKLSHQVQLASARECAYEREALCVRFVQEALQYALSLEGAQALAYGRNLPMSVCRVRQALYDAFGFEEARANAYWREALYVSVSCSVAFWIRKGARGNLEKFAINIIVSELTIKNCGKLDETIQFGFGNNTGLTNQSTIIYVQLKKNRIRKQ